MIPDIRHVSRVPAHKVVSWSITHVEPSPSKGSAPCIEGDSAGHRQLSPRALGETAFRMTSLVILWSAMVPLLVLGRCNAAPLFLKSPRSIHAAPQLQRKTSLSRIQNDAGKRNNWLLRGCSSNHKALPFDRTREGYRACTQVGC